MDGLEADRTEHPFDDLGFDLREVDLGREIGEVVLGREPILDQWRREARGVRQGGS
jgi:hypothetical protein